MKQTKLWLTTIVALLCSLTASAHDFSVGGIYYDITSSTDLTVEVTFRGENYASYSSEYNGVVTIPETVTYSSKTYSVTSIGDWAFYDCTSLTAISIPESVTSIGNSAFSGCSSLTSITVDEGNSVYDSRNECNAIIETSSNSLIKGCTSTVIPEGVTSIGEGSFSGCSGLTSITLPESVTSIGRGAFRNCSSLTAISIPESVTSIGKSAFERCSSLTAISIPESVTSIGYWAFCSCSSLTSITVDEGNSVYDSRNECNAIIETSSNSLIQGCTSTVIPEGVTSIGEEAFRDCSSLTTITIPEGVTSIGSSAFSGCLSLTSITIPESVTSIGDYAFYGCISLKTIINYSDLTLQKGSNSNGSVARYAEEVIDVVKVGDYGFATIDNVHYLLGYTGNETELILPDDYQGENYQIRKDAFRGCSSLTSIIIPEGVTSIGEEAFYGCENLKMVINCSDLDIQKGDSYNGYVGYYADRVFNVDEVIEDYAFKTKYGVHNLIGYIGDDTELTLPTDYQGENYQIEDAAFYNCSSLTSITIPEGVTRIGNYAFDGCSSLKSIIIEDGSTTLSMGYNELGYYNWDQDHAVAGQGLFYDCPLEEVYLGRDLSYRSDYSYGYSPFYNQTQLKYLTIGDNVTSIGEKAFYNCSSLTAVHISSIEAWCCIDFEDLYANPLYYAKNLYINGELVTELVIPNSVTAVKDYTFYNCSSLTVISIPENSQLTSIGNYVFYNCSSLTVISIPENSQLTSIGRGAFRNCSSLTAITIPESVTSIGEEAFRHCSSLTSITVDEGNSVYDSRNECNAIIETSSNSLIQGCTSTVIPEGVTSIGWSAFEGCSSLTAITIPEGVTSIGSSAFYGCENLKMVINYSDLTLQKGDSGNGYVAYYADKVVNVDCIVDGYCFKTRDGVHCLIDYLGDDTALVLPEDYQGDDYVIAESVFQGNEEIVSVKIPQTVGTIGNGAFADCANLASVEMARGVMSIGDKAFENCTSLASVTIPQNMRSIGHGAFKGCSSLASVEFKEGVETFGDNAFEGCAALTEIMLSKSLTAVGANAFKGCSGLTSVIVDKNVETFGTGAFEGCTVVKTLVVKGSVMPTVPSSALTLIVLYSPHPLAAEEFANKVYRDATLYVPTGSIARYQAADVWKNFWTIKEFDSTQEMSLSLDQTAATLTEDESLTLTASITPEFMADMTVTWSTSDDAVATVDEHGVVTALAAGTATITATTGGMQATCVVTVTKKEGEVVGIENSEIRNHESEIIYDLSGRRVTHPAKGIYIINGKKVVIK